EQSPKSDPLPLVSDPRFERTTRSRVQTPITQVHVEQSLNPAPLHPVLITLSDLKGQQDQDCKPQ
ncbi:hypothetical protein LINPERPRIM_LOCUS5290, partial [Linum perenne]